MNQTARKITGTVLILVIAIIYAVVATTIASAKLAEASGWIHLIYFLVTGIFWIVPAMFLITWMSKPDKNSQKADLGS